MGPQDRTRLRVVLGATLIAVGLGLTFYLQQHARQLPSPGQDISPEAFARIIDAEMTERVERYGITGVFMGVIHDGRPLWSKGYGYADPDHTQPITDRTVFNVGSVSKPLAVWGVLILVADSMVTLDDPIAPYLHRWQIPPSEFNAERITFRHLLQHTSGLSVYGFGGIEPWLPPSNVVEVLEGKTVSSGPVRLIQEPGTQWRYSGGGYTVLQLLIEELTGLTYAEYMNQTMFAPLGMTHSGYNPTAFATTSREFNYYGKAIRENQFVTHAAAGLYTSGADLERFLLANLNQNTTVLPSSLIAASFSPTPVDSSHAMSYSRAQLGGNLLIGHGGNNMGWNAQIYLVPKTGDGLYFLTNTTAGAQLEIDLSCTWKAWVTRQDVRDVCTDELALTDTLHTYALLSGWLALTLLAALAYLLLSKIRVLTWRLSSRRRFGLSARISGLVLLTLPTLLTAVMLFTDWLLTRQGITLMDDPLPLHELDFLSDFVFISLIAAMLLLYSSPHPAKNTPTQKSP